ncbi:MAG TPA: ribosome biogenesis GTPase Der [Stellaceae bacterium]
MPFTVAIVGRPNVGKSTLFNRLVGRALALVDDAPGSTRDRREGDAKLGDLRFRVIDTAGLDDAEPNSTEEKMQQQTALALETADAILFLFDARAGVTALDRHFADRLRRAKQPVILVANKAESLRSAAEAGEAFALGLGEPVLISAGHGEGMAELFDALAPLVKSEADDAPAKDAPLRLAIVGRPNVGKSTLINSLLGGERLVTGPEPGITRDAIAIQWHWRGHAVRLVDTAGMRRKSRIDARIEQLSVDETLNAIRFAEIVVLVIDATQPLEKQDLAIAELVEKEGRGLVLAASKWDLVEDRRAALEKLRERVEFSLPQLKGLRVVTLSGLNGAGIDKLMPAVIATHRAWSKRISTPILNRWLASVQERHPPPLVAGRRLKLRFMSQANIHPPTFALFASKPGELPDSYRRYLVNLLREKFDLPAVPIRMMLRKGGNPYVDKDD